MDGGTVFDYRLSMALPEMLITYLKEVVDDDWSMGHIGRWGEKLMGNVESPDQCLVGDKTITSWLMDKVMYTGMMSSLYPVHTLVSRGMSLHKIIRIMVRGLASEGYINFMGNEFGHPKWLNFPRVGNGES
jgi:1,4-alpha-glucan branching enzyme